MPDPPRHTGNLSIQKISSRGDWDKQRPIVTKPTTRLVNHSSHRSANSAPTNRMAASFTHYRVIPLTSLTLRLNPFVTYEGLQVAAACSCLAARHGAREHGVAIRHHNHSRILTLWFVKEADICAAWTDYSKRQQSGKGVGKPFFHTGWARWHRTAPW